MAYKLFDRLRRATMAFGGAPDPQEDRGISPQMQSNLDKRAAQVRFQGFRRMQGRPGITGPFGFVAGRTAPISPQAAAGWVSGKLGTGFAPELGRLTAPDPKAFAEGELAPEFAQAKLTKRVGAGRLIGAEAGTLEAKLPFVPRREEAEIAGLVGTEERAGELAETELGGIATPEELAEGRAIARKQQEAELKQLQRKEQLAAMADDIASLEEQGYPDEARQIRQQRDVLLGGEPALDRTPPGGVPRLPSVRALGLEQERAQALLAIEGFTSEKMEILGSFGPGRFRKTTSELKRLMQVLRNTTPERAAAMARELQQYLVNLEPLKTRTPGSRSRFEMADTVEEFEALILSLLRPEGSPDIGGAPLLER